MRRHKFNSDHKCIRCGAFDPSISDKIYTNGQLSQEVILAILAILDQSPMDCDESLVKKVMES